MGHLKKKNCIFFFLVINTTWREMKRAVCPIPFCHRLDIPEAQRGAVNIYTRGACPLHMLRLRQQPQHRIFNCVRPVPKSGKLHQWIYQKKKKKKKKQHPNVTADLCWTEKIRQNIAENTPKDPHGTERAAVELLGSLLRTGKVMPVWCAPQRGQCHQKALFKSAASMWFSNTASAANRVWGTQKFVWHVEHTVIPCAACQSLILDRTC